MNELAPVAAVSAGTSGGRALPCARGSEENEATDGDTLAGYPSVASMPALARGTQQRVYYDER